MSEWKWEPHPTLRDDGLRLDMTIEEVQNDLIERLKSMKGDRVIVPRSVLVETVCMLIAHRDNQRLSEGFYERRPPSGASFIVPDWMAGDAPNDNR